MRSRKINKKRTTDNTTDKEIAELLRHIEPDRLNQFITKYAYVHASFKKDILKYFHPQKPQKSITNYRKIASACFASANFGYGKNYNFYEAAYTAEYSLYELLEKAKYFTTLHNYQEAAAIAQSIIEVIPSHYEMVDDSNGGLGSVFNDAIDLLLTIVENGQISKELKTEIFHWVGEEVKKNIYSDYGFDEIHSLLVPCTQATGLFNEALDIAEERIQGATSDYRLESAVLEKIELLRQNDLGHEVESTINQHIDLVQIRQIKLADLLAKDRHGEATMLIKEGIKVAEKKDHPGTVSDWKDQLINIYNMLKDHGNIVKYAEDLFYNGRDAMKYYHILKKESPPENWATRLDALLSKNRFTGGYPNHLLADIYIEEKYWTRLLQLVEKSDIRVLETYEKYLKPRFSKELMKLFAQKLTVYAERNMGRDHYHYVAGILKKLRSYPDGNSIVNMLLTEFNIKYKARKAMMEELRAV